MPGSTTRLTALLVGLAASVSLAMAFTPIETPPAEASDNLGNPVIGAVGDMACDSSDRSFNNNNGTATNCAEKRTSDVVLADASLDGVLGLGDYQYDCDDPADFAVSYTPTWGRLGNEMTPVAGNHEYKTGTDVYGTPCPTSNATAATFFNYFTHSHPATYGHFSFDLGQWHLIGLNGNCGYSGVGGCRATSPQTQWLKADLAATTQPCILAFWHQPLFTGINTGKNLVYKPWWDALYAAHADVVLNGHIHNYQRFAPLAPDGTADSINGITEYIVGTGGEKQVPVNTTVLPQPVANAKTFGYLRMALLPTGWQADFIDSSGAILDASSSGVCHV